jgi:hypothetical protein
MPTITARQFEYEELKSRLNPGDKILILSCNACARQSDRLGGEEGLQALAGKLEADGFSVHHQELIPIACSPTQLDNRLEDEDVRRLFQDADVVIPLACDAGNDRVRGALPNARILRVTKTLGKGTYSPERGARLTEAAPGVEIEIKDSDGLPVAEAARRLGLHPGSF